MRHAQAGRRQAAGQTATPAVLLRGPADRIRTMNRETKMRTTITRKGKKFKVGQRVRALYPNADFGTGIITAVDHDPKHKPLVVTRDDGQIGYFHVDQVAVL